MTRRNDGEERVVHASVFLLAVAATLCGAANARATFAGRNGRLVVASVSRDGDRETALLALTLSGKSARPIVRFPHPGHCYVDLTSAVASSDGRRIAYSAAWYYDSPDACRGYPHPRLPAHAGSQTQEVTEVTTVNGDGSDRRVLFYPPANLNAIAYSPDGRELAVDDGFALAIIDGRTGKRLGVIQRHLGPPIAWRPNGDIGIAEDRDVFALDIDTVQLETSWKRHIVTAPGDWSVRSLSWSPDGSRLAFGGVRQVILGDSQRLAARPADCSCTEVDYNDIFVATPASGKTRRLTRTRRAHDPVWSPDGRQIAFVNGDRIVIMPAQGGQLKTVAKRYELLDWAVSRR